MSHNIIACRIDVDGLHIKKVGTFAEGHTFQIEAVPPALMEKVKAGETAKNRKGEVINLCSFLTPEGAWVSIKDAHIPQYGIGVAPGGFSKKAKPEPEPEIEVETQSNEKAVSSDEDSSLDSSSKSSLKIKKKPKIGIS
jgi:hypothetical protein